MKIHQQLKQLYTECFSDSESCVSYLFNNRLTENNAKYLTIGEEIQVAMYLVPKRLNYLGKNITIPFVVGLSTSKNHRNKGLARQLMHKAIKETFSPFIFLYPAVKGFYEKMDFATVSYDDVINNDYKRIISESTKEIKRIYYTCTKDMDFFFELSEKDIAEKMEITHLDGGDFYLLEKEGKAIGYGNGEENILLERGEQQKGVMARIVDLQKAFELLDNTITEKIKLTDKLIKENNMCFSVEKGTLVREKDFDIEMTMAELTEHFFGLNNRIKNFPQIKGYISERY